MNQSVGIIAVTVTCGFQAFCVHLGRGKPCHQLAHSQRVGLPIILHVATADALNDLGAVAKRSISPLEMEQYPHLKAGNGDDLHDRQRFILSGGEPTDFLAGRIKARMAIAVEYTEYLVVTTRFPTLPLRTTHDVDGGRTHPIVGNNHFGACQPEMDFRRRKVRLLGLSLTHNKRNGPRGFASGLTPKRFPVSDPRDLRHIKGPRDCR